MRHSKKILSEREKEVIRFISEEYSTKEIAEKMQLSSETVKSHRKNIMLKMNVRNAAGLVRAAFEMQVLTLPQ